MDTVKLFKLTEALTLLTQLRNLKSFSDIDQSLVEQLIYQAEKQLKEAKV